MAAPCNGSWDKVCWAPQHLFLYISRTILYWYSVFERQPVIMLTMMMTMMMMVIGLGHNALADGWYTLYSRDRQPALDRLAQVPVRQDEGPCNPRHEGPSQQPAAAPDSEVYSFTSHCTANQLLWYRPTTPHQLLQVERYLLVTHVTTSTRPSSCWFGAVWFLLVRNRCCLSVYMAFFFFSLRVWLIIIDSKLESKARKSTHITFILKSLHWLN